MSYINPPLNVAVLWRSHRREVERLWLYLWCPHKFGYFRPVFRQYQILLLCRWYNEQVPMSFKYSTNCFGPDRTPYRLPHCDWSFCELNASMRRVKAGGGRMSLQVNSEKLKNRRNFRKTGETSEKLLSPVVGSKLRNTSPIGETLCPVSGGK